eukprot:SAG22_NODE_3211_length_1855_cov_1.268223_2_plen_82_part_00
MHAIHCSGAPEHTAAEPRVGLACRYMPWWVNHLPLLDGSAEREAMLMDGKPEANVCFPMSREVFESLPESAKPLLRVWVED